MNKTNDKSSKDKPRPRTRETQGLQYTRYKQDTPGNNQGLNQEEKLKTDNTTKAGNRN